MYFMVLFYVINFKLIFVLAMQIQVLKSKIHGVKVTEANLDYIGSITIDEDLMDAANVIENEKVLIVDKDNGSRLETYIIKGKRGSGVICLNGAAARLVEEGDELIIMSFALMDFELAKKHIPQVIFPDKNTNKLK
jgi:aspartate 1-decarboxylase